MAASPRAACKPAVTAGQRAAWLTAQHYNTPAITILDSLGRDVISIAHNRVEDPNGSHIFGGKHYRDDRYFTFTKLDAEGKPLWIRDARGNLVMQYITPVKATRWVDEANENIPVRSVPCYDIAGNMLFQHSMDGGDRWMLFDAAGKGAFAWDFNQRQDDSGAGCSMQLPVGGRPFPRLAAAHAEPDRRAGEGDDAAPRTEQDEKEPEEATRDSTHKGVLPAR